MGKRGKELKKRKRLLEEAEEADGSDSDGAVDVFGGIPVEDVEATCRTLEALGKDLPLFRSRPFKRLRAALAPAAVALVGGGDDAPSRRKKPREPELTEQERRRVMDRDALNQRALRRERLDRLEKMLEDGAEDALPRIADGPAVGLRMLENGDAAPAELHGAISCYTCKAPFTTLHAFYANLCPACAALNWGKRDERCDLAGRGALVTGARVKIGFRVALKLLRCGARVVATTRYPADCASRFNGERDADEWRDRLVVVGCDFRDLRAVEALCAAVPTMVESLDILVNNACQTVRRPPQYYATTVARELKLRRLLGGPANAFPALLDGPAGGGGDVDVPDAPRDLERMRTWTAARADAAASDPALASMLCVAPGDDVRDDAAFPAGATDANGDLGQQLDLRTKNSWMLKLDEVSTPELAEVFAINALAPFVINSKLAPFMRLSAAPDRPAFVVNVSAMEGKFYRHKQPTHPHTNMAKAALNMMTRTAAADLAKAHVYMTAVDTGWINDEKPTALAFDHAKAHDFQTPLDEVDAAARILDPAIAPLRRLEAGDPLDAPYGVFLKDYAVCEW